MVPTTHDSRNEFAAPVGHIDPLSIPRSKILAVLWAVNSEDIELTESQTIHSFASSIRNGTREERLEASLQLSKSVPARLVQTSVGGTLLNALVEEFA